MRCFLSGKEFWNFTKFSRHCKKSFPSVQPFALKKPKTWVGSYFSSKCQAVSCGGKCTWAVEIPQRHCMHRQMSPGFHSQCWSFSLSTNTFYIQSFSLTECIGIVWVRKIPGLSVCLCVCLCVCVSVCLSVCVEPWAETTGSILMKLCQNGLL